MRNNSTPRLALFFLDALRYGDIDPVKTPFLWKLRNEGLGGPMRTLLAYEGIAATLFTGMYPYQHGVWTRYYADPANSPFKWINPFATLLDRIVDIKPLTSKMLRFLMMRVSNSMVHASYFPGVDLVPLRQLSKMSFSLKRNFFEPGCFALPSLFDILKENSLSFRYVDHGLFDSDNSVYERALYSDTMKDVMLVRFIDLDTATHDYGLEAPGRTRILRETDRFVEGIVTAWRQKNPDLAVLCFADHGMVSVESSLNMESIIVETGLKPFEDFGMFLDSTMARFWGDSEALSKIQKVLERLDCGKILSEDDKRRYMIPDSQAWGSLIFLVKSGFVISPNFFDRNGRVKAMHGYDPATPGLETVFILHWPQHVPHRTVGLTEMVDVLPTTLDILGLLEAIRLPGASLLRT